MIYRKREDHTRNGGDKSKKRKVDYRGKEAKMAWRRRKTTMEETEEEEVK